MHYCRCGWGGSSCVVGVDCRCCVGWRYYLEVGRSLEWRRGIFGGKIPSSSFFRFNFSSISFLLFPMCSSQGGSPPQAASNPKPRVAASTILSIGVAAFVLAAACPLLLLVVTLLLSVSIPYRWVCMIVTLYWFANPHCISPTIYALMDLQLSYQW